MLEDWSIEQYAVLLNEFIVGAENKTVSKEDGQI